jgi:hypothetical protein
VITIRTCGRVMYTKSGEEPVQVESWVKFLAEPCRIRRGAVLQDLIGPVFSDTTFFSAVFAGHLHGFPLDLFVEEWSRQAEPMYDMRYLSLSWNASVNRQGDLTSSIVFDGKKKDGEPCGLELTPFHLLKEVK